MYNCENLTGLILNDRYRVLEKTGVGGMAIVYKAHDNVLDRDVAIKVLRDSLERESSVLTNFIKEARSSASLVHPNVVSVYDVCEYGGINYMVMEFVDGITLKEYIKQNPCLPWQEACDYAIQIGQGIQAAHERNIIHRDIKPQNIIMDTNGVLKVSDFGIAKAMEGDKVIAGGTAMGSVHYISPEQARGGYTDFRSDIYSLGVVLYEMLAGRVPFDGDSPVSVALMHIEEEPINVKCVNMDIPADLAYVTMKAMNREQSKRYQCVREMLEDLRAVLADESLPSREEERAKRADELKNVDFDLGDERASRSDVKKPDKKYKEQVRKKKTERNAVILALSTVAVLLIAFFAVISSLFTNKVPDLVGMTLEDAIKAAQRSGYKISDEVEYSFSDDATENTVISQLPGAGEEASKDEEIKLVVSLGSTGGSIAVPDFIGSKVDDTLKRITDLSLVYNIVYDASDEEVGTVIRQTPLAGTHVNEGDVVTIHISNGSDIAATETTKVKTPSLQMQSLDDAKAMISANGLSVGSITYMESDAVAEGKIIKQKPDAGTVVNSGTLVSLVVSKGSAAVQTPAPTTDSEVTETTEPVTSTDAPTTSGGAVKRYSVRIPDDAGEMVHVKIVANGNVMHDSTHSKSEGVIVQEITGNGNVRVQTYIDGVLTNDETVTF